MKTDAADHCTEWLTQQLVTHTHTDTYGLCD